MALSDQQQLKRLIEISQNILVVFPLSQNGDALASSLGLKNYLEKFNKRVDVASSEFKLARNYKFLDGSDSVLSELGHLQKFIVKVDVSQAPIENLSYSVDGDWLSIYLTPKSGNITRQNLRTAQTTFKYDLIITLGAPDLSSLGDVFHNNTDLFYRLPIINLDRSASNERFGQINLVNLSATCVAEVALDLIRILGTELLDQDNATALLAGMISATHSFKDTNVTPHTLALASELISHGADREKIIKHLYRTRSVAALKLWGKALSELKHRHDLGLVYCTISSDSFRQSGANMEDINGLIDELISTTPEAKISLVLCQSQDHRFVKGYLSTTEQIDANELTKPLGGKSNKKNSTFVIDGANLQEAEELVLKTIEGALNI